MGRQTTEQVTEGLDLSHHTIIVTGGTNGLGKETVRILAKRGAHVFIAARNLTLAETVKEEIVKNIPSAKIDLLQIDVSSLESVRTAAKEFLALNVPLNVLVCNAGTISTKRNFSADGIGLTFATNYLGHVLLTQLLLEKLKVTATESGIEGRIVNVASEGHEYFLYPEGIKFDEICRSDKTKDEGTALNFKTFMNDYGESKLAQILYTKELAKRLKNEGVNNVTVNSLHPGTVRTNILAGPGSLSKSIFDLYFRIFGVTVLQGAYTQVYLAVSPELKGVTGKYYLNGKEYKLKEKYALDEELQTKLWDFSTKLISA